jgi:hypothetical protein
VDENITATQANQQPQGVFTTFSLIVIIKKGILVLLGFPFYIDKEMKK